MKQKKKLMWNGAAFIAPIIAITLVMAAAHLYPFGGISNLRKDLDIQYIEYFAWLKRVLMGEASISYSFSKSLGGSLVALFGYYLNNPLNLLVVFFPHEKLPLFVFILSAVKLGLCGLTASVYFRSRFEKLSEWWVLLYSFAYAMMSYNMTQLSNIMWIDGVIMLPLVMLVVYRAVKQKKYGMFYLLTAVNVILNWYTGYMICLFSVFYFLFEWFLHQEELGIKTAKKLVIEFLKFCFVEGLGVVLSGVLFYPVIVGLSNGKPVYDPAIFEMNTKSPLLNLLRGFVLGTVGDMESLSLYCGLPILIFIVFYFLTKKISVRKKVITGIFLGFMLVSCWLLPLDCIWSGLRFAYSYYSRFSFLVIFLMLFIGASACETIDFQEDKRLLIKIAGGYIGILLIFDYLEPFYVKYLLMTIVVLLVYIVIASIKISKRTRAILFAIVLGGDNV